MAYNLDSNYRSLDRLDKWDEPTQGVIKKRLEKEINQKESFFFLTEQEGAKLAGLIDLLLPQKEAKFQIKIAQALGRSLSDKKSGVRYGSDPWRGEFYKKGLKKIDKSFSESQLKKELENSKDNFLARFLRLVLQDAISVYYSHPLTWDKIGFPGPAYPEGYAYLGCGEKDSWEPKYAQVRPV